MVPGLGLVPAQINLQSCVPAVQVHNYHTITQTICVPLIVVTMAVPPSIQSRANTRSSLGPTETATPLPLCGAFGCLVPVSPLSPTQPLISVTIDTGVGLSRRKPNLYTSRHYCIRLLGGYEDMMHLHPPQPLCSPVMCSYRRNFCRLFVSNYIINYAKANGKNYHIYFYCVGMDICMNIKLYE